MKTKFIIIIAAAIVIFTIVSNIIMESSHIPERKVSAAYEITGIVDEIITNPYDMYVKLKILSTNNSELKVGSEIIIRIAGIGSVESWRAKSIKTNDTIRITVKFVEDEFWEANDKDWSFIKWITIELTRIQVNHI